MDVSSEIVIKRTPEVVTAYASNPDNVPGWYANIKSVEWKTPRPLRVGSKVAFVARFLGRTLAYTYEIVELDPSHLIMRTAEGPFPMETTYTWQRTGTGHTQMTLRNRGTPSGFWTWIAPYVAHAVKRANEKDLWRLKQRLEAS